MYCPLEPGFPHLIRKSPPLAAFKTQDNSCYYDGVAPFEVAFSRGAHPGLYYKWQPTSSSCPLLRIGPDPTNLCFALQGRNILLVGDSTTFTMHEAFVSRLFAPRGPDQKPMREKISQWTYPHPGLEICGPQNNATDPMFRPMTASSKQVLRYVRNDNADAVEPHKSSLHHGAWLQYVDNNTLIILNTGSHFRESTSVLTGITQTLHAIRKKAPL